MDGLPEGPGLDFAFGEMGEEGAASGGEAGGVEPAGGFSVVGFGHGFDPGKIGEGAVVRVEDFAFAFEELGEEFELGGAESGLEVGHAVVVTDLIVDEFDGFDFGGGAEVAGVLDEVFVVGDEHAAAAGGDEFVAVEAEAADGADGAAGVAFVEAAERFGGVFDDGDVELAAEGEDGIEVYGVSEDMDGHDGADAFAAGIVDDAALGGGAVFGEDADHFGGVHLPGVGLGVHEEGFGEAVGDRVDGGDEGFGADEDEIAGFDAADEEGDVEGGGAVHGAGGLLCAEHFGEFTFKFFDEGAGGGDPAGVEALFDVLPFVAGDIGDAEGDGREGGGGGH